MKKFLVVVLFVLAGVSCHLFSAKIYTIPPCALDHWDSVTMSFPHNRWETEFSFKTSGSYEDIVMIAPVNLPDGVTVKKLMTYLTDNTDRDEARMMIILGRHNLQTGVREQMVSLSTRGCNASPTQIERTASTINYARINNDKYSYHLIVIFGMQDPDLKFHGAKIYY